MNEKVKSFFIAVGGFFAAIGAFLFGRYLDRRRVQPSPDGLAELSKGISSLEAGKRELEAGLAELRKNNSDAIGSSDAIRQHIDNIENGLQSAIDILERAKARQNNQGG